MLREIKASEITELTSSLLLNASLILPPALKSVIEAAEKRERSQLAKRALKDIVRNAELAEEKSMPICQDCGLAVIFAEIGQDVHIIGGDFETAINDGVRKAYQDGYLRKSSVIDPLFDRKNSGDNTPAVIHTKIVSGDRVKIAVSPKGMGSENMSRIFMLKPADGVEGVVKAVIDAVKSAGPNPCPPIVLGIGIGGNFETAPLAAKRALLTETGLRNQDERYAKLEERIIREANALGIGAGGYGGDTTVLDAHIIAQPTHIAGMPLAVNICCHALRHAEGEI